MMQLFAEGCNLLESGEGGPIVITKSAADLCVTLRNSTEYHSGGRFPVAFPHSVCQRAVRMLELCAVHARDSGIDTLTACDALQLAEFASYLEADALSEVACTRVAELLTQSGSADEVCARFEVECDLTQNERAAALSEVPWTEATATGTRLGWIQAEGAQLTGDGVHTTDY